MLSLKLFYNRITSYNRELINLLLVMFNWLLIILKVLKLEKKESDSDTTKEDLKRLYLYKDISLYIIDYIHIYMYSLCFNFLFNTKYSNYTDFKTKQLSNSRFYIFNNKFTILSFSRLHLYGLKSIWYHIRF